MSKTSKIAEMATQIAAYQRRIRNLEAGDVSRYVTAQEEIVALHKKCLMGSGIVVEMHHLAGPSALSPVIISDGPSVDLLRELLNDIRRSHSLRLTINQLRDIPSI